VARIEDKAAAGAYTRWVMVRLAQRGRRRHWTGELLTAIEPDAVVSLDRSASWTWPTWCTVPCSGPPTSLAATVVDLPPRDRLAALRQTDGDFDTAAAASTTRWPAAAATTTAAQPLLSTPAGARDRRPRPAPRASSP